jgi:hypothetical protein
MDSDLHRKKAAHQRVGSTGWAIGSSSPFSTCLLLSRAAARSPGASAVAGHCEEGSDRRGGGRRRRGRGRGRRQGRFSDWIVGDGCIGGLGAGGGGGEEVEEGAGKSRVLRRRGREAPSARSPPPPLRGGRLVGHRAAVTWARHPLPLEPWYGEDKETKWYLT